MTEQASSAPASPQQGATTPSAPQPATAQPSYPDKVKVKIEGKEVEVPFQRLIDDYSLQSVSTKRLQEASQLRKEVDSLIGGLSKKDRNALQQLVGVVGEDSFRELAENYLYDKIQFEQLPDSDKKRISAEKRAEQLEQALKEKESESQQAVREQLRQKAWQEIDNEVAEHLKSSKYKTPRLVARAIETILANHQTNGTRLPLKDAWTTAERDIVEDAKAYLQDLDLEDIKNILGKEKLKALRQADVETVRTRLASKPTTTSKSQTRPEKAKTLDDWFTRKERRLK